MHYEIIKKLLTRKSDSNKYEFGHVLIIGGSPGMVGAPFLSAMGALRAGAGLVTIASTPEVIDKLEKRVLEIMTVRIPSDTEKAVETIREFIDNRRVSVVVLGPGMDAKFAMIAKSLVSHLTIPVILDAGALTGFGDDISVLDEATKTNPHIIATPHDGEFEKLSGTQLPSEIISRKEIASQYAQTHNLTLLCKGSPTLVAHVDGSVYENNTGNPGLATAGSGDVLAGIIAGLIAQGCNGAQAADVGAYVHGLAGDLAEEEKTEAGMIASDIVEYLPAAFKKAV